MYFLLRYQFQDLMCGVLLLLIIIIILGSIYLLGKNYMDKRNSYYSNMYQKAVDKAVKKKEKDE